MPQCFRRSVACLTCLYVAIRGMPAVARPGTWRLIRMTYGAPTPRRVPYSVRAALDAFRLRTHVCVALTVALVILPIMRSLEAQRVRPLIPPPEFTLDQWTTVDGLPQNSVNAIAQTPDGYVWVGTFGGLARFDGMHFKLVERTDTAGRHVDRVLSLAVAPDSSLWVGTENGLLQYHRGQFTRFGPADKLPDHEISALRFDRAGRMWVGTARRGAARYENGRFTYVRQVNGLPIEKVASFVEDRDGATWINSTGYYVKVAPGDSANVVSRGADNLLLHDGDDAHWFVVPDGVVRERAGNFQRFAMGFGPEVMIPQELPGRYWWATFGNGVVDFRPDNAGRASAYSLADGASYGARALLNGFDGNVWVGTIRNGLLRLKRNLFTTYVKSSGLSNDIITPVMETRDGSLWVGTNCGGLNVVDSARRLVRHYSIDNATPTSPGGCVFSLAQDSAGAVWVGTWGGGLTRFENGSARHMGALGLRDSVILALFTDRGGTLWIGTNAAGLAEVRDGRVRRVYSSSDGLAHNSVRFITQARDGAMWIGTLEGLSRLDENGRIRTYRASDGLSSPYVRAIHEDADGTLWIGTYGGGIHRLRDGKFVGLRRDNGLADDAVSSIVHDGRGNLWMTGNRGIFRVSRAQLNAFADGKLRRVHSVLYGMDDGLVNAETNGGFQPAAWKDHTGRLWFPTIRGLATVVPAEATEIPRPPSVTVEEIVVDGESRPPTGALRLSPGRPNVEFRYGGVSLSSPQNVTFRYKLEGLDDEWVEPGTRRVAYYSRLPAGEYRFLVTAANRDGVWNPTHAVLSVAVLAPLYQRPWFIAATLLIAALALLSAHRAVLRTRSAAIHMERSRMAREIHDSLLQGFGGIALQLHVAVSRLSLPASQKSALDRVLGLADRTLIQARQAVWDLRPAGLASSDFATEIDEAARRILNDTPTSIRVHTTGRKRRLNAASQMESLRIVEEAIINARKHAEASRVTVAIDYRWSYLRLTITDDGKGFDAEHAILPRGHWGLLGVRERASRIGAKLTLRSGMGVGTMLSLNVPYNAGLLSRFHRNGAQD